MSIIRNLLITECEAKYTGGGIYWYRNPTLSNTEQMTLSLTKSKITGCNAASGSGGGVCIRGLCRNIKLTMDDVLIKGNHSSLSGAGLHIGVQQGSKIDAGDAVLTKVTIEENVHRKI